MNKSLTAGLFSAAALGLACAAQAQTPRAPATLPAALSSLAADAGGVLGEGADVKLLLNETDHGVTASRTIGVGEEYREGWKVTALTQASVTLAKGPESRTIALAGRRQTAAVPAPAAGAPAPVAASNSLVGGSGRGAGPRSPAIQAAVTAGDLKQVLQLGGSASDAAAALSAQGRLPLGPAMDLNSAQFVQIGDRYAVSVSNADGSRRQVLSTPDFDGFTPTGPVTQLPAPNIPAGGTGNFIVGNGNVVVRQVISPPAPPAPPVAIAPAR